MAKNLQVDKPLIMHYTSGMRDVLDLRCPNRPFANDEGKECRSRLQGPELASVLAALQMEVPFVDYRYCTHCKVLWRITIESSSSAPMYELIPKGTQLPLVADTDAFGVTAASGRKLARKAS